jgi:hypothetical protein
LTILEIALRVRGTFGSLSQDLAGEIEHGDM